MNADLKPLQKIPPDIQSQSESFHCIETNIFLIAIPWTDGIQFCWTIKFLPRRPNFCQKYKKHKFVTPRGHLYLLIVQGLWQNLKQFQQKIFLPKDSFWQIECKFNNTAKNVSSKFPIVSNHDLDLCFRKSLEKKHALVKPISWTRSMWFRQCCQLFSIDNQNFSPTIRNWWNFVIFSKDKFLSMIPSGHLNCRVDKPAESFPPKKT